MNSKRVFFITVFITVALFCLAMLGLKFRNFEIKGANQMRFGIDIRGGVEATYEPKDLGQQKVSWKPPGRLSKHGWTPKISRTVMLP